MAAIKSDFASLPEEGDESLTAAINAVLTELKGHKWPLPAGDVTALNRATVVAHLQDIAGGILAAELAEDSKRPNTADAKNPIPRLYQGQSDAGIAGIFNQFRAGRLFNGLPHAPNAITADDVAAAKKG
jgi:hypothetical protein